MKHPMQKVVDCDGITRFTENKIVRYMVDELTDLNTLAIMFKHEESEDWQQLMQLIGYSVSAAPIDLDKLNIADIMCEGKTEQEAKIEHYEKLIGDLRKSLREPVAELYNVHPDDLMEAN